MKSFVFSLQKVLDWRRAQLGVEEDRLRRLALALAALDREREELERSAREEDAGVRGLAGLAGEDLGALDRYRRYTAARGETLAAERIECVKKVEAQQAALVAARRRHKLLERLREQKLAAWTVESRREVEAVAAESFLARWPGQKRAGEAGERELPEDR